MYTGFSYYSPAFESECETRIGDPVNEIIQSLIKDVKPPTPDVEQTLNQLSVNRWKIEFEKLETQFEPAKKELFIDAIQRLAKANAKNPNIENIYFEAAKFIAKHDKTEAVKFYIKYIYHDLLSQKIDKKQFSKTIQKLIFKTPEQTASFDQLIIELEQTRDLEKILADADRIFQPKRKKIQIDQSQISEVIREDQDTVALLNVYLDDDSEEPASTQIAAAASIPDPENTVPDTNKATLSPQQLDLLSLFAAKSFSLSSTDLNDYCKAKAISINHAIDSINEPCYESLDDLLIEVSGNNYTLNEKYYKQILQP